MSGPLRIVGDEERRARLAIRHALSERAAGWLGATKTAVRRALADVRATPVLLTDGSPAWLPDDVEPVRPPDPWAALLPALDPTTMRWRGRGFYVDDATASLVYDFAGNGRATAWWNGRIVGSWRQDAHGQVAVVPFASPDDRAACPRSAGTAADALLDGDVLRSGFYRAAASAE